VEIKAFQEEKHEKAGEKDGKKYGKGVKDKGVGRKKTENIRRQICLAESAEQACRPAKLCVGVPCGKPCPVSSVQKKVYLRYEGATLIGELAIGDMRGVRGYGLARLNVIIMRIDNLTTKYNRSEKYYVEKDKDNKSMSILHVSGLVSPCNYFSNQKV